MTRIGLIGAGFFGAVHARALARIPGAELAAVSSGEFESARAFAAQFGGRAHADWRALLDDPAVEVVAIATPHALHADIAIAALEAGRHVFLEKPMAATPEQCRALEAAAAGATGLLMIGHVMHFFRPIMAACEIVASGELGRPVLGRSALIKLWMESNRRPWHLSPESGGGMLMTAGIHALDQLVWLMEGRVASVTALAGTLFHEQAADDSAFLGLRFADGRIGQVASIGYRDGAVTNGLELVCERGVVAVDLDSGVRVGQGGVWRAIAGSWEENGMDEAVLREWNAFLGAIAQGTEVPVGPAYGRHIVEIIHAALRSSAERQEIAVAV
ncbi:MAG TPA: Gfo/Idh/MocA family oxidoreductase [Devosia sp.]|nr:Gfo/Idh/MocA family oxidoreductase [Devosia sp.]